ncbi:MAG: DoxX family protein, partial [Dysgonamonadaceae bacterium]|nr:DoxX family protein [Dysgonamonadaceae bacterium]
MNRANIGKYQQTAVEIGRVLVGVVFVFSGFVKAVDPWGTAYKFHDYFAVWNLTFLDVLALPASLGLSAVEFTLGACLLAGVYRKIVSGGVFLFMCFMTILTLYLMIFNPVTDCGCFGDALVITNAQTFWKNVVLLAASGLVFRGHRRMTPLYSGKYRLRAAAWAFVFIMSVSVYAFRYLPPLDFRPYRIGNNIPEQMQIPEGAAADVYETTLIYEKDGIRQKFTIENYPKEGSGWTFVETLSQLVKKGYEPPIHGFSITTAAGDDITDEVLTDSGYTFLLVAHKLENADDSNAGNINAVYDYAVENRYRFLCLTASLPGPIAEWKDNTGAEY